MNRILRIGIIQKYSFCYHINDHQRPSTALINQLPRLSIQYMSQTLTLATLLNTQSSHGGKNGGYA